MLAEQLACLIANRIGEAHARLTPDGASAVLAWCERERVRLLCDDTAAEVLAGVERYLARAQGWALREVGAGEVERMLGESIAATSRGNIAVRRSGRRLRLRARPPGIAPW